MGGEVTQKSSVQFAVMKCQQCESESFEELNGHYVCTVCGLQSAEAIVTVFEGMMEEGDFDAEAGRGQQNRFIRAIHIGPRRTRSWVSWEEAIQTILRAQCDILIADFGFPPQMVQLVGKLWFHYLASSVPLHRSKSGAQNEKARERQRQLREARKEHVKAYKQFIIKEVQPTPVDKNERARRRAATLQPRVPYDEPSDDDDDYPSRGPIRKKKKVESDHEYVLDPKDDDTGERKMTKKELAKAITRAKREKKLEAKKLEEKLNQEKKAKRSSAKKAGRNVGAGSGRDSEDSEDEMSSGGSSAESSASSQTSQSSRTSSSGSGSRSSVYISSDSDDTSDTNSDSSDSDSDTSTSTSSESEESSSLSDYEGDFAPDPEFEPILEQDLPDFIIPKQRGAHYTTLMRESLTMHLTLELLFIGILYLRLPVLPRDLVEWAATGRIPYLTAFELLPTSMSYYRYLKPYSIPSARQLLKKSLRLAKHLNLETPIPPLNEFPLLSRMATLLEVAPEIERAAFRILKITKMNYTFGMNRFPYEYILSHLLMAIKTLYQFNDTYSLSDIALKHPNITAKCLPEWLNEQFILEKNTPVNIPWVRKDLENFPNYFIEEYIDFLKEQHSDKMKLNPEITELQTMFDARSQGHSLHHPITDENIERNVGRGGLSGAQAQDAATRIPCFIDYGVVRKGDLPAYTQHQPQDASSSAEAGQPADPVVPVTENAFFPTAPTFPKTNYYFFKDTIFGITFHSHEYLLNKGAEILSTPRQTMWHALARVEQRIFGEIEGRIKRKKTEVHVMY